MHHPSRSVLVGDVVKRRRRRGGGQLLGGAFLVLAAVEAVAGVEVAVASTSPGSTPWRRGSPSRWWASPWPSSSRPSRRWPASRWRWPRRHRARRPGRARRREWWALAKVARDAARGRSSDEWPASGVAGARRRRARRAPRRWRSWGGGGGGGGRHPLAVQLLAACSPSRRPWPAPRRGLDVRAGVEAGNPGLAAVEGELDAVAEQGIEPTIRCPGASARPRRRGGASAAPRTAAPRTAAPRTAAPRTTASPEPQSQMPSVLTIQ